MTRTPSKESRSSSEELIKDLNKRRGVVRGKFRLFMKYVDSVEVMTTTETIKSELQTRLQKVDLLLEQFTEIQDEIDLKIPDSQVEKELSERESFETNYYAYVTKAKCIINADDVQNSSKIFSKVKLPTISLPSFDGSYDHWLEYRDTYLSLVHNSKEIDNVQKFHYLRSSLSGSALLVIKSLEFSSENYNVAWELLENRFNNNRLLVQTHVKALFSMTSLNKESPNQIRKLIDTVLKNLRSLKNLGEPTESWDTLIIYLITSKLDSVTEREWETHKSSIINSQNQSISRTRVDDLITFLKNRADVLETINFAHSKSYTDNNIKKPSQSQQSNKSHSYTSTQNKQPNNKNSKRPRICAMCQANHPLYSCESFLKLNINDRIKFVNEKKLCCNCLRANHSADECWFGPCKQCNKKHNNLLHDKCDDSASVSTSPVVAHNSQASSQNTTSGKSLHTATLHSASHTTHQSTTHSLLETVLLSTALVEVADKSNNYHTTRALLDNGSQHSFIAESLCKRLKLNLIQSTVQVSGVGNSVTNSTQSCEINLRSKTTQYNTRMKCLVLNQITAQLPCLGTTSNINIPDHVQLADSEFYSPSEIELLIGADKFWELLTDGLIRLSSGPYLQNTQLGWVISGPLLNKKTSRNNRVQCNYSQSLDAQLRKFWELEELPPQNKLTNDESLCENLFLQTTYRDNTGRFFVRIPLAEPSDTLGDTYALALNRFHALERKLDKSTPEYKRLYCDFMNEYLSLGHMSRVNSYPSPNYFLPHHGVLRIHSSTTKLRVVFDGSAKSTSGKSLNDIQHIGPSLHNDPVTIPRLELCGALVGAKLYQKIVQSWRLKFNHIYFWSDSMIVINWIKMSPNLLKTFVQNRVVQINELTGELPWLHVAGKDNPADLLSRGLTLDALQSTDIWWHGPAFLKDMHMNFKYDNQNEIINLNDLPEMKSKVLFTQSTYTSIFIFERFSNFNRMRRAAAYVLRFINNARIKSKTERSIGPLTADELNKSTLVLVRLAQHASFADILNQLINNLPVKSMRNISSLDVFLDSDRIIRVGGRLVNSRTFPYSKKHPILLCSKHTFTRLLFQFEHKRLLHAGPQLLLATIRESWWPLRGRDLAKQTVHKCIICTRQKGKALSVKMGNLPFERLEPGYPFLRCGVDYAGPMFILNRKGRGSKLEKCYVCLFICFTTRAIHLELVTSLTSEAYLLALKRFLCRRGKPAYIFSDNGKTFVGALKEFSDFLNHSENDILNFAANENIKFSFIPPYSPHFGGLWEAGVKSFKYHLRRVGNVNLTYEEFSTLLAQIEALLNSRPMYPMSSDPNDLLPLTPAHFLIGRPLTAPACEDLTASNTSRLVRYERIEQMRQNFWKRWSQEYVSELQTRTKWQYNTGTIAPNTLVLIKDDNLPPLKWRLGRVITTFPGKDGLARVADIKTANGVIRRSYPRLCPLLQEEEP
ncbi:uncharacterized protein LOC124644424 [Helicoverpa zea]|uniref:uncharacterized protein LOC124644424 n=1 Tax=Helicoverpa zea TaxID=7113 RepID=UPI001F56AE6D|nr:uncharacterized protein LOC124644424 [Helicoverpa zea]